MALLLAALVFAGCAALSSSGPVKYQDPETGFALTLPASWRGYSIVPETDPYLHDLKTIIIRNPLWTAKAPYVDFRVYACTLEQWASYENGGPDPFPWAGGSVGEIYRNSRFVFVAYSRDNNFGSAPGDPGWQEGGDEVAKVVQDAYDRHPEVDRK